MLFVHTVNFELPTAGWQLLSLPIKSLAEGSNFWADGTGCRMEKIRYASFNCQKWKLNVAKALHCQRRYCILNTIEKAAWPGWTRLQECKKQ